MVGGAKPATNHRIVVVLDIVIDTRRINLTATRALICHSADTCLQQPRTNFKVAGEGEEESGSGTPPSIISQPVS